ncbi:CAP domain-containing protein [Bernardetia sp.]|uniref:CAP domain-containing protein n=1 Tax=Bernardetia sp. TaxID=1937974 RepID=UPI0025BA148E|nr:CAP domain-containing protein [Bernardetia sp.]
MRTHLIYILSLLITIFSFEIASAQDLNAPNDANEVSNKPYVDYKPIYKKWQSNYILDKIDYTKDRTIFHFRYVSHYEQGTATYYGPGTQLAWFLKNDANQSEVFKLIEIKNIARNGKVEIPLLNTSNPVQLITHDGDVFTCEVHFPRLPNHVKVTDFIEGIGAELKTNHFNCLNVEMKTFDSQDLGSQQDMIANITDFQEKEGVTNNPIPEIIKEEKPIIDERIEEEQKIDGVFAQRFLELTNELRTKGCHCGGSYFPPVPEVSWSDTVAYATKELVVNLWKSKGMTTDIGGKNTVERLADVGIETERAYENMSYSFTEIEQAFRGWKLTPPQCKRLMDARVKRIGAARKEKYWSMILIY